MRFGDRLQRLRDREDFDLVFDLRAPPHACRVDQRELATVALERHENAVARGAGDLAGDEAFIADEPVDERGLSDVGPADDGDADAFVLLARRYVRKSVARLPWLSQPEP